MFANGDAERKWPSVYRLSQSAVVVVDQLGSSTHSLLPEEGSLSSPEVSSARLRELRAGRTAARLGMSAIGIAPAAILQDPVGRPVWPSDISGSISHSAKHVAVVLARSTYSADLPASIFAIPPRRRKSPAAPQGRTGGGQILFPQQRRPRKSLCAEGYCPSRRGARLSPHPLSAASGKKHVHDACRTGSHRPGWHP